MRVSKRRILILIVLMVLPVGYAACSKKNNGSPSSGNGPSSAQVYVSQLLGAKNIPQQAAYKAVVLANLKDPGQLQNAISQVISAPAPTVANSPVTALVTSIQSYCAPPSGATPTPPPGVSTTGVDPLCQREMLQLQNLLAVAAVAGSGGLPTQGMVRSKASSQQAQDPALLKMELLGLGATVQDLSSAQSLLQVAESYAASVPGDRAATLYLAQALLILFEYQPPTSASDPNYVMFQDTLSNGVKLGLTPGMNSTWDDVVFTSDMLSQGPSAAQAYAKSVGGNHGTYLQAFVACYNGDKATAVSLLTGDSDPVAQVALELLTKSPPSAATAPTPSTTPGGTASTAFTTKRPFSNSPMATSSMTPSPTGSTTPMPTGSTTPMPTGSTTPTPTGSTTPMPTGSTTPTPSSTVTPLPPIPTPGGGSNGAGCNSGAFDDSAYEIDDVGTI